MRAWIAQSVSEQVVDWRSEEPCSDSLEGREICFCFKSFRLALRPNRLLLNGYLGLFPAGGGSWAIDTWSWALIPISAQFKGKWNWTSRSPICLLDVHRKYFELFFSRLPYAFVFLVLSKFDNAWPRPMYSPSGSVCNCKLSLAVT